MGMRVGIVGCGTAGQAAALFLARHGHGVTVFEQAPTLGPVGAGLLLQPTGLWVLERLGVDRSILALASPVESLLGTTHRGRRVLDVAYRDLREGLCGYGVQRSALSETLLGRMLAEGIRLELGTRVCGPGPDGRTVVDSGGGRHGPFDLVVAADGGRSRFRACFPGLVRRDRPYSWGAVWAICDDADGRFDGVLRQVYRGTREMIGFLPSGRSGPGAPERVSLFWSLPTREWPALLGGGVAGWKRRVRSLTDLAEPLLEQIGSMERLIFAPYRDTVLRGSSHGRVVFLGDAGHSMSPQLGQGVNLALLDAAALADALAGAASVEEALRAFDAARRRSTAFYSRASRWLTPVFQSRWDALAWPRDALLGACCRFGPTRRQALLALAGVKTGVLRSDALPDLGEERA
ncbi:MAG: FAD-dependent oxidoreductase [Phycisphaerales bacterium JB054]